MIIAQVKDLAGFEKDKHGRVGEHGGYYHYEFCIVRQINIGKNLAIDFARKFPHTMQDSIGRTGYTAPKSEINIIGEINV